VIAVPGLSPPSRRLGVEMLLLAEQAVPQMREYASVDGQRLHAQDAPAPHTGGLALSITTRELV
jgi:hypothetical protein